MIRTTKSNYYKDALLSAKGNCSELWQLFKNVIGDTTILILTPLKVKGTHTVYLCSSLYIINLKSMIPRTHFHCITTWVTHSSG